jgi:hypothetical protein
MHAYEVGKPYSENRRHWPELAQYNYRGGEHELVLFLARPTSDETQAVRRGDAELALFVERSLIVLLYRFGQALPWSDAPYSIHLVPFEQRTLPPETGPEEHALLQIILVDAGTGIIKAMRVVSMSPDFTQTLHNAIRKQFDQPFTRSAYNGELEKLFARYSSADLAKMAQIRFSYPGG